MLYIKACFRPKTVGSFLVWSSLKYPITCNYTRLSKQTPVLDESGHDCGKCNNTKCNRIPTQRSMQKLYISNWLKRATKYPTKATPLWLKPHRPTKQAELACKLEGKTIRITIVVPPMKFKGKNDDNEIAIRVWTVTLSAVEKLS